MTTTTGKLATRRLILQGAASVALIGLGNWPFAAAHAAANDKYPEEAFKQKSEAEAIKALYGRTAEPSDKVKLDAPEIAENGGVVPVSVTTTLDKVTSISFLVAENPFTPFSDVNIMPVVEPSAAMAIYSEVVAALAATAQPSG